MDVAYLLYCIFASCCLAPLLHLTLLSDYIASAYAQYNVNPYNHGR